MSDEYDDEEEAVPPPRTMRTAPAVTDDDDDEEAFAPPPRARRPAPTDDDDDDEPITADVGADLDDDEAPTGRKVSVEAVDDEDNPTAPKPKIRGGWTEGQKTMDSTSTFAQALKLDQNTQVIQFLDAAPYANYRRHWVERASAQGTVNRAYTCLETVGKACPLCDTGDRPQAVSAFNVVLLGDDGQVILKTWDVGARLFNTLKAFGNDPKTGPLTKNYFAVSKTGKGGNTQYNVIPVRARDLKEDYDLEIPDEGELARAGKYDSDIIDIPKRKDLQEIADDLADDE